MSDNDLRLRIATKLGVTEKHVSRLVLAKQRERLYSRRLAVLAVALDAGLAVHRDADDAELAELRTYESSRRPTRGELAPSDTSGMPDRRRPRTKNERVGRETARAGLGPKDVYDVLITDERLRKHTRKLFRDSHYAQAIEQSCKLINNVVKDLTGAQAKDGADLMHHAFKLEAPILRINALQTRSDRDAQDGYRLLLAGLMSGLRNPRAHEHDLQDEPLAALEILAIVNHLLRVVDRSTRV